MTLPVYRNVPGLQEGFRKIADPMTCPGCYSLDLYCDHENDEHEWEEFPHQYLDERGSVCRKLARQAGWKLHRNGTATCPKCVRRLEKEKAA